MRKDDCGVSRAESWVDVRIVRVTDLDFLLGKSRLNEFRIASCVCAGQHNYSSVCDAIPNQVRKSPNDRSANIAMDNLIDQR